MDKISVLIPYKPDFGQRDKIFHWVRRFYQKCMPDAELCVGGSRSRLFSRAEAINNAAREARGNIYVVADADTIYNPAILNKAADLLQHQPWIIPYARIFMVQQASTDTLLNSGPEWPIRKKITVAIKRKEAKGRLLVISKKNFRKVRGFDERFQGWGGEDDAFSFAADTLCGKYYRMEEDIYHLWHPISSNVGHTPEYKYNAALTIRYYKAYGNRKETLQILKESKDYRQKKGR